MEVGCGARPLRLKFHNFPPKRAYLPRLRLPLPVHGGGRRALVSSARRAPRRGGIRGHVPDPPAVGRRRRAEHSRRPRRDGRAAVGALRRRQAADRACTSLRVRCPAPSPRPGKSVRRRPFGLDAVLPPARRRSRAAARPLPAPRRLDRGLDARLLAKLSRPAQGDDCLDDPAARHAGGRARVLLLAPPRAAASR